MEIIMFKKDRIMLALAVTIGCLSSTASAYDLIYSPIVEYGETEVELYGEYVSDDDVLIDGKQQYMLEVARGVTPALFLEVRLIAEKMPNASLETEAVAIEGVYQLTEQGEYDWDIGLFGEIAYSVTTDDLDEIEFGPILATDIGRNMTFTTNLIVEYEKVEKKFEGNVNAQLKWRFGQGFEPAIEFYGSEYNKKIGPVIMGKIKTDAAKFGYQLGWLFGMDDNSEDNTVKFLVEYEF